MCPIIASASSGVFKEINFPFSLWANQAQLLEERLFFYFGNRNIVYIIILKYNFVEEIFYGEIEFRKKVTTNVIIAWPSFVDVRTLMQPALLAC